MFLGRVLGFTTRAIYIIQYYIIMSAGRRYTVSRRQHQKPVSIYSVQVTIATQTNTIIPGDYIKRIWPAIACSDGIRRF